MVEYPYFPTVGRNMAAMAVETAWLINSAMLMPLERIRVGISSESASHTQTPGPIAKNAMKTNRLIATSIPLCGLGSGVISALSILSGAWRAASRLPKGCEKNATTLLAGTQLSRVISIGVAAVSSERAALVAARKSPYEYMTTNEVGRSLIRRAVSPHALSS